MCTKINNAQTPNSDLLRTGMTNQFEDFYLRLGFCAAGQLHTLKSRPDSKPKTVRLHYRVLRIKEKLK